MAAKVFISYVDKDEAHLRALETHLAPLVKQGVIAPWSARALAPGEPVSAAIGARLENAAIVLVLASPEYLADEGGDDGELGAVLRRQKAANVRVIPVLVRPCFIQKTALDGLQKLPGDGRPITAWQDADAAWLGVVQALDALLSEATPAGARAATLGPVLPRVPHFLGRDALADEVTTALTAEPATPVVLLGAPGIGKTTLSVAVMHRPEVVRRFGARRVFVRLEGSTSADAARTAVATAIGLPPSGDVSGALRAWLAEAPALVVLDNLETPLHADRGGTETLLATLGEAPDVVLLASVRGDDWPEGIAWSTVDVTPLVPTHDVDLFCKLAPRHASARAVVAELVAPLGGVPLAVALFAIAARGNDLSNLRREWQTSRTATLARGGTDTHASWAACVDVSFRSPRMTPDADRLARVIALLPDGAASEDLTDLLPDGPAAARVLVQVGLAHFEAGRLRMLPPLRDHLTATRAPAPEDHTLAAEHYRKLAATLGPRAGATGGREAIEQVAAEWGNVEAMVTWGLSTEAPGPWIDAAAALRNFVRFSGLGSADVVRAALGAAEHTGNIAGAAACAAALGHIAFARSDQAEARVRFEAALPLYRRVGSVHGEANCIRRLGDIALERSDHAEARTRFEAALALFQQVDSVLGEANCIKNLGNLALARSDHAEARTRFETALALLRQVGHVLGEASCIQSLGDLALRRSDHAEARVRYEAALPLYRQVGDVLGEANCILGLGDIASATGRTEEARANHERALALYARIPEPYSMGGAHRRLARLASTDAQRRRHVEAARQLWTKIDRPDLVAELDREFA